MKIPVSWLRDFVPLEATAEDIAEKLTFSGVEVEGIERIGARGFPGVVVGDVRRVEPHPNADRLRVCTVFDGTAERQVVCGAPNVFAGARAPFAPVGTELPNGLKLKRATLRGVESFGMLCAEDELGLSDEHEGLLLLPNDLKAGSSVAEALGLPDAVLELEVTWNRPDCLCVLGIARELAALYGLPLTMPEMPLATVAERAADSVSVRIDAPELCSRYVARLLRRVKLASSPFRMRQRLRLCGVRPINNVVDITNYVMLEMGQPLHAFDFRLLTEGRIVVRRAESGEPFATLDGVARALTPDMLVIADARHPVALAGVMGGAGSEIRADTESVLLESAAFDPASIHATSRRMGLGTESSHRFERGVPAPLCELASRRAASLMQALCGAEVLDGAVDAYPAPTAPRRITLRFPELNARLGVTLPRDEVVSILGSLDIQPATVGAEDCEVEAPWFRPDLEIEADLIEEVARIHGLDGIPSSPPACPRVSEDDDGPTRRRRRLQDTLQGLGLSEIMNYSFLSERLLRDCRVQEEAAWLRLPNPVSSDYAIMRPSLIPQMVATLGRNLARQTPTLALYELGRVFRIGNNGLEEAERLCFGLLGAVGDFGLGRLRREPSEEDMFLWAKGFVEALFEERGWRGLDVADAAADWAAADWCVEVRADGRTLGRFGLLSEAIRAEWRMTGPVAVAEFDTGAWLAAPAAVKPRAPSPYPAVSRDIALIVDERVRHADVERAVRAVGVHDLTELTLFDTFRGEGIGVGCKSMAYSLTFRSNDRSLTDEEANGYQESIKQALVMELKAVTR